MKKYELYIDFDGVILDTITDLYNALNKLKEEKQRELTLEEQEQLFINYDWKSLIDDRLIINDNINCIKKLEESNRFYIAILTHVNSLEEAMVKIRYIRRYFNDITIIPCPKRISKTKMVHTKDAILVDDYSENLKEWQESGGIPIKFSNKANKKYTTINRLDKLLEIFK